jgi:hypothetical protein
MPDLCQRVDPRRVILGVGVVLFGRFVHYQLRPPRTLGLDGCSIMSRSRSAHSASILVASLQEAVQPRPWISRPAATGESPFADGIPELACVRSRSASAFSICRRTVMTDRPSRSRSRSWFQSLMISRSFAASIASPGQRSQCERKENKTQAATDVDLLAAQVWIGTFWVSPRT